MTAWRQTALFADNRPRARATDPDTSHAAARSVRNIRASQFAVLRLLARHGPLTDVAIAQRYREAVNMNQAPRQSESGLRTRRAELVQAGLVADTGQRAMLASGRHAIVWQAVQ